MADHPDLNADRRGQNAPPPPPPPAGTAEGADAAGAADAGGGPVRVPVAGQGHATREALEVSVPIWRLTPKQRAELLRIVEAGGRSQRKGIPREQPFCLAEAGYLAVYDDGLVMLTPAALRAITIEADRRAAARDAAIGQRAPLSS